VQIKLTNYTKNRTRDPSRKGTRRKIIIETILQIIDISDSILYDDIKAQSEFLELINACVSHELRNPLNSIVA